MAVELKFTIPTELATEIGKAFELFHKEDGDERTTMQVFREAMIAEIKDHLRRYRKAISNMQVEQKLDTDINTIT